MPFNRGLQQASGWCQRLDWVTVHGLPLFDMAPISVVLKHCEAHHVFGCPLAGLGGTAAGMDPLLLFLVFLIEFIKCIDLTFHKNCSINLFESIKERYER